MYVCMYVCITTRARSSSPGRCAEEQEGNTLNSREPRDTNPLAPQRSTHRKSVFSLFTRQVAGLLYADVLVNQSPIAVSSAV